jgi:hypothetical protein
MLWLRGAPHYREQCPHAAAREGKSEGQVVPWVAEAYALEKGQQPHPFTGSEAPPGGRPLRVRLSGVVSARPLGDIWRMVSSRLTKVHLYNFYLREEQDEL